MPIRPSEQSLNYDLDHKDTPIPQPGPLSTSTFMEGDLREPDRFEPEPLRALLISSIVDFTNAKGFGLIVNRQKVAGFQAHQFKEVPEAKEWKVQRLELVGLLMHEQPVVYLSDELPRMEKLRHAPTRALSSFETAGIEQLRNGDDLFIRQSQEGIRMLGAVRSVSQCVKCHDGERGDLLGAFSYYLQRQP